MDTKINGQNAKNRESSQNKVYLKG